MEAEMIWRDVVREAAQRAKESKLVNFSELARRVNWPQPQIEKFLRNGSGDYAKVIALERELRSLGFIDDHWKDLAREMHVIADVLMGSAPESQKRSMLSTFVETIHPLVGEASESTSGSNNKS